MLAPRLESLQVGRRTRPDAVLGDKAYSSRANRSLLRSRKIEAVIYEPADQKGHRLRRGSKGGRPPKFDAIKYKGRTVIERGYARLKQWRGLATRYDILAVVYRAAVFLNVVIACLEQLSYTLLTFRAGRCDRNCARSPYRSSRAPSRPGARPARRRSGSRRRGRPEPHRPGVRR